MIAERAGVSQATVSRALKQDPRISKQVITKVQRVADKLGYRPDPAFQRAMTEMRQLQQPRLKELLALVGEKEGMLHGYAQELGRAAEQRADELGFVTERFLIQETDNEFRRLNRMLCARNIKGILLMPFRNPRVFPKLDWTQFATVTVTKVHPDLPVHGVHGDGRSNVETLGKELMRAGYRRPGLLLWGGDLNRQKRSLLPEYYWLWHEGLNGDPPPWLNWQEGVSPQQICRWFDEVQPDALMVAGIAMKRSLEEILGERRCQGLGWVSYSAEADELALASVRVDFAEVGRGAMDLLTAMIGRGESGLPELPKQVRFKGRFQGEISSASD